MDMTLFLSISFAFILPFNGKQKFYLIDTNEGSSQKLMEILDWRAVPKTIQTLGNISNEEKQNADRSNNFAPQSLKQDEEIVQSFLMKHPNAPESVKQLVKRLPSYLAKNVKPTDGSKYVDVQYVKAVLEKIQSYSKQVNQGKPLNNSYDDYGNNGNIHEGTWGSLISNYDNYGDYADNSICNSSLRPGIWKSLKFEITGFNFFFLAPYIKLKEIAKDIDESGILQAITMKVFEGINFKELFKSIDFNKTLSGINFNSGLNLQIMAKGFSLSKMLEGIDIAKVNKSQGFNQSKVMLGIDIDKIMKGIDLSKLPKQVLQIQNSTDLKGTLKGVESEQIGAAIKDLDMIVKDGIDFQVITDGLQLSKIEGLDLSKIMEGIELKKVVPGINKEAFIRGINIGRIMRGLENGQSLEKFPFIRGIDIEKIIQGINIFKIKKIPKTDGWMRSPDPWDVLGKLGFGQALRAQRMVPLIEKIIAALKESFSQSVFGESECFTEPNKDYLRCDLGAPVKQVDWKACRDSAAGVANARYWTFRFSDRFCWMKSSKRNKKSSGAYISGNADCTKAGPCESGWELFEGQCYKVFWSKVNVQTTAQNKCEEYRATLVNIETEDENRFVIKLLDKTYRKDGKDIWIGAKRKNIGSPFVWSNGKEVTFADWDKEKGHPRTKYHGSIALCTSMFRNKNPIWKWYSTNCDGKDRDNAFVCEIPESQSVESTSKKEIKPRK